MKTSEHIEQPKATGEPRQLEPPQEPGTETETTHAKEKTMKQFRTIEQIMQDFQRQHCQELPAIPKDGIIRNEEGRPIGYIEEDGTIKMPRHGEQSWKTFFATL